MAYLSRFKLGRWQWLIACGKWGKKASLQAYRDIEDAMGEVTDYSAVKAARPRLLKDTAPHIGERRKGE